MVKEPKTRAGVRVVYLSKELCKLLRAWGKECQWEKEQWGDDELTQDDYLFQQSNGDPMVPCTFIYRFKMILRENGLPGHTQPSTTLDIYRRPCPRQKQAPRWAEAKRGDGAVRRRCFESLDSTSGWVRKKCPEAIIKAKGGARNEQ